jgi:hypothetical protein
MARFRKGDTVFYFAQGDPRMPIRARVEKIHRDNSFTVEALFHVSPMTGEDSTSAGLLGYRYRIYTDKLMSRLGTATRRD